MLLSLIGTRMLDDVHRRALERLEECVESRVFSQIVGDSLKELSIEQISHPQELLQMGDCLMRLSKGSPRHSGTISMMGRLMRTRAILLGAKV